MVSSQRLIPLPLIQDAKEWLKEINATKEDVNLNEIFKELQTDYSGRVPIDKFKHRVANRKIIQYQSWLSYLQLVMTVIGVLLITYKISSICMSKGLPLIKRLMPNLTRRKKDRVREYRIV